MKRFRLLFAPAALLFAAACSTDPVTLPEGREADGPNMKAVVGTTASGDGAEGSISGTQSTGGSEDCYQITVDGLLVTVCDGRTPSHGSGG